MTARESRDRPELDGKPLRRVHLVGIGGAGMSGIARIMLARGVAVSGSDARDSAALTSLRAIGADVHVGHDASYVEGADAVVMTSAVRGTNPEVVAAGRLGIPVVARASALAALMRGRRVVAIAGTHGKTTTTSMLTTALQHCGADPSFAIGGSLNESGANAHDGTGDVFVAEADESDGSFLLLSPDVAVVTNVEPDHLDHHGSFEAVEKVFVEFVDRLPSTGFLVACADDAGSRRLAATAAERGVDVRTYGTADDAAVRVDRLVLERGLPAFEIVDRGRRLGRRRLRVPGAHNALNAAAAYAAGSGLGYPASDLLDGIAAFGGTRRRFEAKGIAAGVRVFDDYAHHPTEVRAVLAAARAVAAPGRVVACFQPHLFSRTSLFATEFGSALGLADEVVVMDVYGAREDPVPGVTGGLVAAAVPLPPERVTYEPSWSAVPGELARRARPGDLVLTIGAGDVTLVGPEVLEVLAEGRR